MPFPVIENRPDPVSLDDQTLDLIEVDDVVTEEIAVFEQEDEEEDAPKTHYVDKCASDVILQEPPLAGARTALLAEKCRPDTVSSQAIFAKAA